MTHSRNEPFHELIPDQKQGTPLAYVVFHAPVALFGKSL
jgi:hypothetical protein